MNFKERDKQRDKKPGKGADTITRNIVIGMVLLVVLAGAGAALANYRTNNSTAIPTLANKAVGGGIEFNSSAPVRLDMWEDFQCPSCKAFESANNAYINSLVKAEKIHAVYHPMSFIGPESALEARAAGCAADEGKFLEYHTALYANQGTENSGIWSPEILTVIGKGLGIKSKSFENCVSSKKYDNWVRNIEVDASKNNVNSTPTVMLNGKQMDPSTHRDNAKFKAALVAGGLK